MKPYFYIDIGEINTISDLLKITDKHKYDKSYYYNINLKALHTIKDDLKTLNDMIGLNGLKTSILDQLLYFIQNLHLSTSAKKKLYNNSVPKYNCYVPPTTSSFSCCSSSNSSHPIPPLPPLAQSQFMLPPEILAKLQQKINEIDNIENDEGDFKHTVIYGPPGTGKTEVAKILGKIYSKMGILRNNVFKKVTKTDLIGQYLGQTAAKTRNIINECLGGVLFIDEAYSIGSGSGQSDIYAQECIDVLCEALSSHKNDLMVIIAGYENDLEEKFFRLNQGLNSRFIWRFHIEKYSTSELIDIFKKKVNDAEWKFDETNKIDFKKWFEPKMKYFTYYGRDMENLLLNIKISHGRRVFGKMSFEKKIITIDDMNNGFKKFCENPEVKKREIELSSSLMNLYI